MAKSSLSFRQSSHFICSSRRTTNLEETEGISTPTGELGDLLIRCIWNHQTVVRCFWNHQTACILDMRISNLDAPSNIHWKPEAVLLSHEREMKNKYLQFCLYQRRHFSPFVVSCDEAKVVVQNFARSLAKKSGKSYSETLTFMKSRMSIKIALASLTFLHSRITYLYEPNEPTSPVGRWSRPQPVLPLGGQQTNLKI